MRRWELTIALDPKHELPIFLQLASTLADDIRSGRLKAGEALPGTRELAHQLSINRNTVIASYEELAAEGLVNTRVGGGTFVATPMRTTTHTVAPTSDTPTYALSAMHTDAPTVTPPKPGMLLIANGLPDTRLFPATALTRAFRRAIAQRGHSLLGYADPCGLRRLREELAHMLGSTRGLPATADGLMVTRSLEQAIDLVARMLLQPGDVVVVEEFGYPPAWNMLRMTGATLVSLPLDENGLDVDALERLLSKQPIRAVFLTPHHQFPTTCVMSQARRARLAQLALSHGFAIIEDDYDHEFHYAGKPVLPIAASFGRANVIYIGSLANLLAPGISTGFVLAPPSVFAQLASLRATSDARSDIAMESAIAELFEDGELIRHVRRMRRIYESRRDALVDALTKHVGSAMRFRVPDGGMGLWGRVDDAVDLSAWISEAAKEGVQLIHGNRYHFGAHEEKAPCMRLGFSYLDEKEIDEAVLRMARALPRAKKRPARPFHLASAMRDRA